MNQAIEQLLKVQQAHADFLNAQTELAQFPKTLKIFQTKKAEAQSELEAQKKRFAEMNATRTQMRLDRRALEERRNKCKMRLAEVRKNDEFAAINTEIDRLTADASKIEDEEIQLLIDIDEQAKIVENTKLALDKKISEIAQQEAAALARKPMLEEAFNRTKAEFEREKSVAEPVFLNAYLKLFANGKKLPILVPLKGDLCGGCFLKISSSAAEIVLKQKTEPVFCEQCGKMIYV